jgi:hypothetical protein
MSLWDCHKFQPIGNYCSVSTSSADGSIIFTAAHLGDIFRKKKGGSLETLPRPNPGVSETWIGISCNRSGTQLIVLSTDNSYFWEESGWKTIPGYQPSARPKVINFGDTFILAQNPGRIFHWTKGELNWKPYSFPISSWINVCVSESGKLIAAVNERGIDYIKLGHHVSFPLHKHCPSGGITCSEEDIFYTTSTKIWRLNTTTLDNQAVDINNTITGWLGLNYVPGAVVCWRSSAGSLISEFYYFLAEEGLAAYLNIKRKKEWDGEIQNIMAFSLDIITGSTINGEYAFTLNKEEEFKLDPGNHVVGKWSGVHMSNKLVVMCQNPGSVYYCFSTRPQEISVFLNPRSEPMQWSCVSCQDRLVVAGTSDGDLYYRNVSNRRKCCWTKIEVPNWSWKSLSFLNPDTLLAFSEQGKVFQCVIGQRHKEMILKTPASFLTSDRASGKVYAISHKDNKIYVFGGKEIETIPLGVEAVWTSLSTKGNEIFITSSTPIYRIIPKIPLVTQKFITPPCMTTYNWVSSTGSDNYLFVSNANEFIYYSDGESKLQPIRTFNSVGQDWRTMTCDQFGSQVFAVTRNGMMWYSDNPLVVQEIVEKETVCHPCHPTPKEKSSVPVGLIVLLFFFLLLIFLFLFSRK